MGGWSGVGGLGVGPRGGESWMSLASSRGWGTRQSGARDESPRVWLL
jgi:hypothetical protein